MSTSKKTALRLAVQARVLSGRAAARLSERIDQIREQPDRGDINIPTVLWIVASVVFAVAAVAAFNALGNKHLSDLKNL